MCCVDLAFWYTSFFGILLSVYIQLWLLFTLPFTVRTYYMFWLTRQFSDVQVIQCELIYKTHIVRTTPEHGQLGLNM